MNKNSVMGVGSEPRIDVKVNNIINFARSDSGAGAASAMENIWGIIRSADSISLKARLRGVMEPLVEKISDSVTNFEKTGSCVFPNANEIGDYIDIIMKKDFAYKGMTSEEKSMFVYNLNVIKGYVENYKKDLTKDFTDSVNGFDFANGKVVEAYNQDYYLTKVFSQYARY